MSDTINSVSYVAWTFDEAQSKDPCMVISYSAQPTAFVTGTL